MATKTGFAHDVCIIGTGRVGLPLGLSLLEAGSAVVGFDVDADLRETINSGSMPFREPGYDSVIADRSFVVHDDPAVIARSRALIITVGTPLHNHIETDLTQVQEVLRLVAPQLREGQFVCLRSTVAPGTTRFVQRWIERHTSLVVGRTLGLAFCPERIAEGKAHEELRSLPQIIGTEDQASHEMAAELFSVLSPEILPTDFVSAELVKLFNNIARYVQFALANQFALVADTFGANIHEIRRLANHRYPRSYLAAPGLTAGSCLRKDFGMINEWSPYPDLMLAAWKMNEYIPAFLVQNLSSRTDLYDRRVAVLGYSFKADADDTRDSLAPKLHRYILRRLPSEVRVSDDRLPDPIVAEGMDEVRNWPVDEALEDVHCVFVAVNHSGYDEVLRRLAVKAPDAWVVDIWNVGQTDQIFYQAGSIASPPGRR